MTSGHVILPMKWGRSGQSVTASDFGSNGPRFESGRGRCVESLDKALYSHLSQGEAFTLASISYLAILVKYILAKKSLRDVRSCDLTHMKSLRDVRSCDLPMNHYETSGHVILPMTSGHVILPMKSLRDVRSCDLTHMKSLRDVRSCDLPMNHYETSGHVILPMTSGHVILPMTSGHVILPMTSGHVILPMKSLRDVRSWSHTDSSNVLRARSCLATL